MSSAPRPLEFFFDRSLGKQTAKELRARGWIVHLIADFYSDDAQSIEDEVWIAEGCQRDWVLLSKDQKIRYRGAELASLHSGRLFCLANGNLLISQMVTRFLEAEHSIRLQAADHAAGFWKVYDNGAVRRTWP